MKKINKHILEFNKEFSEEELFNLEVQNPVTKVELNKIQEQDNILIPLALQEFYEKFGGLTLGGMYDPESEYEGLQMHIYSISELLSFLNEKANYQKLYSLGLIDYLKFNWGNDRPEFDEINLENIAYLNGNYKCFGTYAFGYDEHHSLYFDKAGNFGKIVYDQENWSGLWKDYLNEMLVKSPATKTLENLILDTIDEVRQTIISW